MYYEVYGYSTVNVKAGDEIIYFNKKTVLCSDDTDDFKYLKHVIKKKNYTYKNVVDIRRVQRRFKRVWGIGLLIHTRKITKK